MSFTNRSFLYGDGFFETIHVYQNKLLFPQFHHQRMLRSFSLMEMNCPPELRSYSDFIITLTGFISESPKKETQSLRVHFYRADGLGYTPVNDDAHYSFLVREIPNYLEENKQEQICTAICNLYPKPKGPLQDLKSASAILYVMAAKWASQNAIDEALILNTDQEIVEANQSNIILYDGDYFIFPPEDSGKVRGVMEQVCFQLLREEGYDCKFQVVREEDVFRSKELWFCNSLRNIRPVRFFKNSMGEKSFENKMANKIRSKFLKRVQEGFYFE